MQQYIHVCDNRNDRNVRSCIPREEIMACVVKCASVFEARYFSQGARASKVHVNISIRIVLQVPVEVN